MPRTALATIALLSLALPTQAAPPSGFLATGQAVTFASAEAPQQSTPIKLYYQGGRIRLEMDAPQGGTSILLARRGTGQVTMLDPAQKTAFTARPADLQGPEGGMPDMDQLLDLAGWKALLAKGGKRLSGSEVKAGQRCSIWEKPQRNVSYKVWFADALELPMQIESSQGGKPRFRITMTRFSPGPQPASLFIVPPGYQQTDLTTQVK